MAIPQPGSIGVEHGTAWASLAIQWGTRSRYNHTLVCESVQADGSVVVIEAAGGGVRRRSITPDREVWDDFHLTEDQRQVIVREAQRCIGFPYDWHDIASFIWRFNRVKITKKPYPDHPDGRLICSELVAWCLRQAGVDPMPGVAAGEVSPGDIADFMFRHEGSDPTTTSPI